MSSSQVTSAHLNVVVNAIAVHHGPAYFGAYRTVTSRDLDLLGRALAELNAAAVNVRYPNQPPVTPVAFTYSPGHASRDLAGLARDLKAVECLAYQCDEGQVMNCDLGRALDRLERELTIELAHATPEYRAAPWGIE